MTFKYSSFVSLLQELYTLVYHSTGILLSACSVLGIVLGSEDTPENV